MTTTYDRVMGALIHKLNVEEVTKGFWFRPHNPMPLPLDFSWRDEVAKNLKAYAHRVPTYAETRAFLRLD